MGKKLRDQWGRGHTPCAYAVMYPHVHTCLLSVLLTAPGLLQAQVGVWAWVTLIPPREENFVPRSPKHVDGFWTCTLGFTQQPGNLWRALTALKASGAEGRGNLYCLQMKRRLSSLLLPSQPFSSASNHGQKCLKRKKLFGTESFSVSFQSTKQPLALRRAS